jgi:Ethanolamine utilization protein EutJ (predicted chaperonin)
MRRKSSVSNRTRYFSVLDLGASAVKAVVIEKTDKQVTILGRARSVHHGLLAQDSVIGIVDALSGACEEVLCAAEDATEKTYGEKVVPDVALIAVPTAWLRGATGKGSVQRNALEMPIAPEDCYEPLFRAGRRAMRNLGRVIGAGKWELVDAALVTFGVDGLRVTDPVGFRGYSLEATSFVTAAPSVLVDALRQLTDKLQLDPPHLVAEPLALSAASPGDGLIVEIGDGTTKLILTRYSKPIAFDSVDQGGAVFTRAIAETFDLPIDRAEALKRAYSAEQLSADAISAVQEALKSPLSVWLSAVIDRLQSWKPSWDNIPQSWPPEIYLCGGASLLPDVQKAASTAHWLGALPFPQTPELWTWDGSNLPQVIDRTQPRWQAENVVSLSLAAWTLRQRGAMTPDGILRSSLGIESEL